MIYVNMTDKFMSGWGRARGGHSFLCVACENWSQAVAIHKAALERPEMRRVAIALRPRRRKGSHTSIKAFSDMGGCWLAESAT
jgi:hypothetical protein